MSASNAGMTGSDDTPWLEHEIPAWFWLEIEAGLEHLHGLRLCYRPATEREMKETIERVVIQLAANKRWHEQADTPRIRAGFRLWGDTSPDWPTPAGLLQLVLSLPGAPVPAPQQMALPAPMTDLSPDAQRIREAIRVLPREARYTLLRTLAIGLTRYMPHQSVAERRQEVLELCDRIVADPASYVAVRNCDPG